MNEIERAIEYIENHIPMNVGECMVKALEKQLNNGWISCSERLPEEFECRDGYIEPSDHVLVQDKNGNHHISRYWKHRRSAPIDWFPWIDIKEYYDIVAWRPLPDKYESR